LCFLIEFVHVVVALFRKIRTGRELLRSR